MSEKEEESKIPESLHREEKKQEIKANNSQLSPYQLLDRDEVSQANKENNTDFSPNNNSRAWFDGCMGCLGAIIYMILVPMLLLLALRLNNLWVVGLFEVLGPVLVFSYAKRTKCIAVFWGFLIPYLLLLLLCGTCTGFR